MSAVELAVSPRYRDLAGFRVNRVWPTARRRLVGPFIFYDHMLARELAPDAGLDVPPHPHIGLATVTYLFDGELVHRDSLGIQQAIRPGDLNWMVAGHGITHSERSSDADRSRQSVLHGTQAWVALPRDAEGCAPDFIHVAAADLPRHQADGVSLRLLAGSGFGMASPLQGSSPLHYAEAHCAPGGRLTLGIELGQRAAYVVTGTLHCDAETLDAGTLYVFADGAGVRLQAQTQAHIMLFGGAPLPEERHVWWNFVASDEADIEAAKHRWAAGEFPDVPGDNGQMSMPER